MTAFDPGAVPPAGDPFSDPAQAELQKRVDEARALLDGLRPINPLKLGRFLEDDAAMAAALMQQHERRYFWELTQELRQQPFSILRDWLRAVKSAALVLAAGEMRVAEKTQLIAIASELLELWRDGGEAWCWTKEHGPGCCWRVPSAQAKRYLLAAYGERYQATLEDGRKVPMAPGRQSVAEALDQLEAIAHAGARRKKPALRVGGDGARIVIDLCRDDYSVVVVEDGGWSVVKPSPLAMLRADGMLPLPLPVQGAGDALGDLRRVLGFDAPEHGQFWALYVGFMFAALRPTPPYFLLVVSGEQGSGKSTTVRVLRAPIDPHETDVQPKPRSEDDLFVNADGQWLTAYDNLSTLDQHWSDAFCRISTGSGYSKRKLYSDRDTARFQVARPQIITAIIDVVGAPDLLDRSLLAALPEIEVFRPEGELYAAADELAPRVLGQLLDGAAVALHGQKTVELSVVPRMVEPTRWIEAAAEALGLEPEAFLSAYLDSQERAGEMALEASLIGSHLQSMFALRAAGIAAAKAAAEKEGKPYDDKPWVEEVGFVGTSKALLSELDGYMTMLNKHRGRGWPRTPRGMSAALRRIAPALRKLGYEVGFERAGDAAGSRIIMIIPPRTTYAHESADGGIDRQHRQNRQKGNGSGACSDGPDGADGRQRTQTVSEAYTAQQDVPAQTADRANNRQNHQKPPEAREPARAKRSRFERLCHWCGEPLERFARSSEVYCSNECRSRVRDSIKAHGAPDAPGPGRCVQCGEPITPVHGYKELPNGGGLLHTICVSLWQDRNECQHCRQSIAADDGIELARFNGRVHLKCVEPWLEAHP
jgi:hypothetical protein